MRHNWITPRMGLFLAAAMLMSSLSALPPVSAAETAMTDDLLSVQGIPVEHTPEIALYGAGNTSPDEQAAYPEDIYSSTMGYDVLNDAQKSLYRKIKAAAHAFYTGTAAAEGVSYGSDEEKLPCFAVVSNTDSSLSNEDTVKVISMFRNDNPMYFFVGNNYLYSMDYDFETEKNYVGAVISPASRNTPAGRHDRRNAVHWKHRSLRHGNRWKHRILHGQKPEPPMTGSATA